MAANRNFVKRDAISATLQARLDNLKRGSKVIQGSLSVSPGHDYWWFLEYGTGQYHETPGDEFNPPEASEGESPEGGPYEITISEAKYLVYMTKAGDRKFKRTTEHPGIYPIGFLRTALFEADISLKANLTRAEKRAKKWDELPGREELVKMVNAIMLALLTTLQVSTPPDSDPDPFHEGRHPEPLAQAWRITKAN